MVMTEVATVLPMMEVMEVPLQDLVAGTIVELVEAITHPLVMDLVVMVTVEALEVDMEEVQAVPHLEVDTEMGVVLVHTVLQVHQVDMGIRTTAVV